MRVFSSSLAIVALPVAAVAQGVMQTNPDRIDVPARALLRAGYVKAESSLTRIRFVCETCSGTPVIDVIMGRQTDGTEQRFRLGRTTVTTMDSLCKERDPTYTSIRSDFCAAVGWRTSFTMGPMEGAILVLLRDGDMLTLCSVSTDSAATELNLDVMIRDVVPMVVGR